MDLLAEHNRGLPQTLPNDLRQILGVAETEADPGVLHESIVMTLDKVGFAQGILGMSEFPGMDLSSNSIPAPIFDRANNTPFRGYPSVIEAVKSDDEKVLENPFTPQQSALISRLSLHHAQVFENKAAQVDPQSPDGRRYATLAAEARTIPSFFIDKLVVGELFDKLRNEGWKGEPLDGTVLAALRQRYILGGVDTLKSYSAFKEGVSRADLAKDAEFTIKAFKDMQGLGISNFAALFALLGVDQDSVVKQAEAAVRLFEGIKVPLSQKIAELVASGDIPKEHENTYAAYSLAAKKLDDENTVVNQTEVSPKQILNEIAQQENITVPDGSVLIIENHPRGRTFTFVIGQIDPDRGNVVGARMIFPKGASRIEVAHEVGHVLHALYVGPKSVFLGTDLPRTKAEIFASYTQQKYGGGESYSAKLLTSRFPLLLEAQLRGLKDLDHACEEGNQERVAEIIKTSFSEPTENMKKTFGFGVAGEGYGIPFGAHGLYANANLSSDTSIPFKQLVDQVIFEKPS